MFRTIKTTSILFVLPIIILIFFFSLTSQVFAETAPTQQWEKLYDSGEYDAGKAIVVDSSGSVYIVGSYSIFPNYDMLVVKYSSSNTFMWQRTYDSGGRDTSSDIAVDSVGDVYIVGYSVDEDYLASYKTIKYASSGTMIWNNTYTNGRSNSAFGIVVDSLNYVYVTGRSNDGVDSDIFTIKYSSLGVVITSMTYNSGGTDSVRDIKIDHAGNICLLGSVYLEYSSSGTLVYINTNINGDCFVLDNDDNIYTTKDNIQTTKYTSGGTLEWSVNYNTEYYEYEEGISVDEYNNVYVIGLVSSRNDDGLIIKYSSSGALVWDSMFNRYHPTKYVSGIDRLYGIFINTAGIFVTGFSQFPTGLSSDTEDVWIFKLGLNDRPAMPEYFLDVGLSTSTIMWLWPDASNIELGYEIWSSTGILTSLPANTTYWIESNLNIYTQYSRRLKAVNNGGSVQKDRNGYTLAYSPTGLSTIAVFNSSATIRWDNVSAVSYAVERSTGTDFPVNWQYVKVWADNISTNTYTDTNLFGETTYWYRVKSYNENAVLNSTPSNITSVFTRIALPAFSNIIVTTSSILWQWTDYSNVESGYKLYTSTDGLLANLLANDTYWYEGNLSPNTLYSRYLEVFKTGGENAITSSTNVYTLARSPTGLTVTRVYRSSVTISWDNVDATRYAIQLSTGYDSPVNWRYWERWADNITGSTYTYTSLYGGTTYWFRVKSYNGSGVVNEIPSNEIKILTRPSSPYTFSGVVNSPDSIIWSWTHYSGYIKDGFRIKTSTGGVVAVLSVNVTYWVEPNLQPNGQYSRTVVAFNAAGESDLINYSTYYTFANQPDQLCAIDLSSVAITLGWGINSNSASTYYQVKYSTDVDCYPRF